MGRPDADFLAPLRFAALAALAVATSGCAVPGRQRQRQLLVPGTGGQLRADLGHR